MKRTIPRSLVSKALNQPAEPNGNDDDAKVDTAPSSTAAAFKGAGSAWKAGALAQSQAAVEQSRAQLVEDILNGRHELQISPDQVDDPLGSDRRDDWMAQEAFQTLLKSIEVNGQDTPILVWPEDANWKPDPLDPTDVSGARFIMLTGRRRHAVAKTLGIKLRAILASPDKRDAENSEFEMLGFFVSGKTRKGKTLALSSVYWLSERCTKRFVIPVRRPLRWRLLHVLAFTRVSCRARAQFSGLGIKS